MEIAMFGVELLLLNVFIVLSAKTLFNKVIEQMTHRTGKYRKFSVFVRLLRQALLSCSTQEFDHNSRKQNIRTKYFVDILTHRDLEELRGLHNQRSNKDSLNSNDSNDIQFDVGKRYLILSIVDFGNEKYISNNR